MCLYVVFVIGAATHGVVPDDLVRITVVSIPKGKNVNLTDSSNYRVIALCSIFGNFFYFVVLSRYDDRLCSSDLQFGFKAKRSTNMCTMVLKEAINYYVNNGSSVFCTLLDAAKAFDRVEYVIMFKLLLDCKFPLVCVRLRTHRRRHGWNGMASVPITSAFGTE